MKKRLITFKVTDEMVKWMIEMETSGNYRSRSELVRDALEEFLAEECADGGNTEDESVTKQEALHNR
ncbi:MAG: ribbon-helix-helix domain-containing protein [Candidatus Heimdallarchaeaceae archaeon]